MSVQQVSSATFLAQLRAAMLSRSRRYDVGSGAISHLLSAVATTLETQNEEFRRVAELLSLNNQGSFTSSDLNDLVANEGIIRPDGFYASTILSFRRFRPFSISESGIIPLNYPVGTLTDASTGALLTFVTTEAKDKTDAVAQFINGRQAYVVKVPARCTTLGASGVVAEGRITRRLRSLPEYDEVTNEAASQGGLDAYTDTELIALFLLAVKSRQLGVATGSEFQTLIDFDEVSDAKESFGASVTRGSDDAGAVDAFFVGEDEQAATEQFTFRGFNQLHQLSSVPVMSVSSVTTGANTLVEGTDYEIVFDESSVSGSIRAREGIKFLPEAATFPAIGDTVTVTYTFNQLVTTLQEERTKRAKNVRGQDLLYRAGKKQSLQLEANVTVFEDFSSSAVIAAVKAAIVAYGQTLKLGSNVEMQDIRVAAGAVSGLDNFVITRASITDEENTDDIFIDDNAYVVIEEENIVLTPVRRVA